MLPGKILALTPNGSLFCLLINLSSNSYPFFQFSYRIKSIGNSGEIKYTAVAWVKLSKDLAAFRIHPNPVTGNNFTVEINNLRDGVYTLRLYNTRGQQVLSRRIQHIGNAIQNIRFPSVAAGVYCLKLEANNQALKQTILVQN